MSLTSHARVNDGHMDALLGKVAISDIEDESSLCNILWLNGVSNIDDSSSWVSTQNDTLHNGNIGITETEVGSQRYYRIHFWLGS